ncbi:MAG TPA: beta-ketoacyl synthase N-terminal-like domain-containing protein, partial [Mycobacteriales bacterium]|nr:beta-ketoacyl synthase N-terminal-like domain-containing protein [Mycobacteriales bacterium]
PREARAMDPQQRLMLELVWEALEDARIVPGALAATRTGVFVGAMNFDYATLVYRHGIRDITAHTATGLHRSIIANRVSYLLGLHGPSLAVDTGQSSGLTAVHVACESLRRGETALALVGGVNLISVPESGIAAARFGGLSPSGRCFVFDARADGYVRGEGGGVVVLKPLDRAVGDGDRIHCVILGSAVNNDGATNGLTAPGVDGQVDVIRMAQRAAGVDPADVQYVELHGTGTRVGDPIEAAALGRVFSARRRPGEPLVVGSVKTNVGHLEGAAGIVGLLKVAMSIRTGQLSASLNFDTPHPDIPLDRLGLRVARELQPWPGVHAPPLAGVSSFGMGGTNCHVVVAAPPPPAAAARPAPAPGPTPLLLSARSVGALRGQAARLRAHLAAPSGVDPVADQPGDLGDVGLSLATTRSHFEHRAVVVATDPDGCRLALDALAAGEPAAGLVSGRTGPGGLAFLFTGQGSQRPGMGRALYEASDVFAAAFDQVCALFDERLPDIVYATPGSAQATLLDQTGHTQPALFAVEVALFRLFEHWGVTPDHLLGHSVGELAAAHVAGVLSLPDAAALVAARGSLIQALPDRGAMVALEATEDEARALLADAGGGVDIAAVNGPRATVVSGDTAAVLRVAERAAGQGRRARRLRVSHAFHSPHMDGMLAEFRRVAEGLEFAPPRIPIVSNVTGRPAGTEEICSPDYWVRHVRYPVRFHDSIRWLDTHGTGSYLELGPGGALSALGQECLGPGGGAFVPALPVTSDGLRGTLTALGRLHVRGVGVDWTRVFAGRPGRVVDLPGYAFDRRRHWLDTDAPSGGDAPAAEEVGWAGRLAGLAEAEADELLVDLVCQTTAAVLDATAPVPTDQNFRDLGLDSLLAVELRNRLSAATGLAVESGVVFNHPTPPALARHLRKSLLGTPAAPAAPTVVPMGTAGTAAPADEPVAIVAIGCRYPGGVCGPEDLWNLVASGSEAISGFPADRGWDLDRLFDSDPDRPGTSYLRQGGFLAGADRFDPEFFGISPREAAAMDPQQRLLLEVAWETFERAGIDPTTLRGSSTGVFVGAIPQEYGPRLHEPAGGADGYLLTGNTTSVASGRLAYFFGF